jgi:hypothetical protein
MGRAATKSKEYTKAGVVLKTLIQGNDPDTGEPFPSDSILNRSDVQDVKPIETVFIVTGFRYGAKRGPGSAAASMIKPLPANPFQPAAGALVMSD